MKLSSSSRHKLHLAPFLLLSSVRRKGATFPASHCSAGSKSKAGFWFCCGALTKPHRWKGLCMSVLRGGWKRIWRSCWNLSLKKNVGGAPWSGARGKEIFRKRLSANELRGPMPLWPLLRAVGKHVANRASQMSSILSDATLPKCFWSLRPSIGLFHEEEKNTLFFVCDF